MRPRCALLSVKWNSDDSATSSQCSAKLIRSAKPTTYQGHHWFWNWVAIWPCHVSVCKKKIVFCLFVCCYNTRCAHWRYEKYWIPHFTLFRPRYPAFSFADVDTYDKNKIRWWSHVKGMASTVLQSKALVIQPEGRRPLGRRCRPYRDGTWKEVGIPMTDVNNWVNVRRPIVYQLDADGRRVRLK